jgi:hypothetical protein
MRQCVIFWELVVVFFAGTIVLPLQGQTSDKTNQVAITYVPPVVTFESTERSEIFARRFFQELSDSDSIVFDRFTGPGSRLAWARRLDRLGYEGVDRINKDGARLFETIALDSLRTAATEALPLSHWPEEWHGWLGELVAGTIGNPQEEHLELTSVTYSAVRTSWERDAGKATVQWGVRPWRTSPYVYMLAHAGRLDGQPLITFETRAGYTMFGSSKIEGRLTFQLPESFRISGSGSVDPARFGSSDPSASTFGVTLERVVRVFSREPAGVFYVGFRSGVNDSGPISRREHLIVAGFARAW